MQNKSLNIILILSLIIFQNNIDLNLATVDNTLCQALSVIVHQTLKEKPRQLLVYANFDNNSSEKRSNANDLIDNMLHGIAYGTYTVHYGTQRLFVDAKHNEVVLLDSVKTFQHFFEKLKDIGNMELSRTLLYISSLTTLDNEIIYRIFKDLYFMEIIRVALVIRLFNGDIVMLTYFPFTPTSCRDFQPVIINRYLADQERWENNKYFPNKLDDFYGCPVYCCTWEDVPYFSVTRDEKNASVIDYVGLEAELLKYAASTLNFSIKIYWIDPIKTDFGSREQYLYKVFSGNCDFTLGGFAYRKDLDYASTFSQTNHFLFSHIYIVTNIINFYTIYEKLAFPFHYTVWFALGLIFSLGSLLICTCERGHKLSVYRNFLIGSANKTPQLNLYALAVGGNIPMIHMPKHNFARFVLICWLLLTFILRTAYQSGMYQMLRENKQWNPPKTIQNVFEQNYLISTTPESYKYLATLPKTQRVRNFNTTVLEVFAEMLNAKEPIALIAPFEYYGYFAKKNSSQWLNLHIVKERVLTQQLTVYVRHHSYFVPVLNEKLSYAQYFGFMSMWKRKTILSQANIFKHTTDMKSTTKNNFDKNPLSMNEMGAIFMILVWLHVFAFAAFLVELMWYRYRSV